MEGRRREDVRLGDLPEDLQPGDYWKYVREGGEPMTPPDEPAYKENLTQTCWGVYSPAGIGTLMKHTVREHDDGTISVRSGDGSSNSIKIEGGGEEWHGYIEHGVWAEVG